MSTLESVKSTIKNYLPTGTDLNDLIYTEMTLAVFEKYTVNGDAYEAFLLLHNYSVIGNINETEETAFLQKAHVCLRYCSSKHRWVQLIEKYRNNVPPELRLYEFEEQIADGKKQLKLIRNNKLSIATERAEIYLDHIRNYRENHNTNFAEEGKYRFWLGNKDVPWAEVKIGSHKTMFTEYPESRSVRPDITISIEELLRSAEEMRRIDNSDHCYETLKKNTIKTEKDDRVVAAEEIKIHDVVNMVGMVGAGKSTLMKVLSFCLSKQHKKIVIVLDTVADTLHLYSYFRKFNMNVTPLIGRGEREKYIYQVARSGSKYLEHVYSEYLTTPCMIAGMADTGDRTIRYGTEPCREMKKDKKKYTCPYIDICPTTKMYRDVFAADVIITTVQGLTAARIPGKNRLFLEYVLEQADLVMFDECDKVQKTLDEFFTPSTDFSEFVQKSSDLCANDMKLDPEDIDEMGENARLYSVLRLQSFAAAQTVRESIQSYTGEWTKMLQSTFSAMTLYQRLCEDSEKGRHPIPPGVLEMLETTMDEPKDDGLDTVFDFADRYEYDRKFTERLKKWLEENECKNDDELLCNIKLYLRVTRFDRYVRSLDEAYSFLTEEQKSEMALFNFLQARFTAQQKLLPSAAMGNLFGMKNDRKKGLQLYRQYSFGRALMNRMPWLRMTENGKPAGPHVLLLSGSSWAEGCLEYHVNVPVQYLLEAEKWKREKLSRTEITELNTCIKVSGGGQNEREEHLQEVIRKIIDPVEAELKSDSKILMIVNSYTEAGAAMNYLNRQLARKIAACMARKTDGNEINEETMILRGDVGRFGSHPARILVAPAQAIERGYNIVDENGHSVFGSVFFLVRPMAVPDEISSKCAKLNGIIEQRFCSEQYRDPYIKSKEIRRFAAIKWHELEEQSKKSLTYLNDVMKRDVTASLFILILQIFGRLARITDEDKPAPRVYFADGAFRTSPDYPDGYDCLNELRNYLEQMMKDERSGEIAKTLYEPFYEAFMRGVNNNVYTDISDGYDPEDEYSV